MALSAEESVRTGRQFPLNVSIF